MSSDWLVEPGYEPVREAFVRNAGAFGLGGGAYAAYVDGRPVVDMWAGRAAPGRPWERGTAAVLMSATKGFAAICVQWLVDRGVLTLDTKVADLWPEFAQNGKADITVRQLLNHTAGVVGYPRSWEVTRHDGTGWDRYEDIAAGLAAAAPAWAPGTKHGYHALTIGWLLGEVVRRADGRTLGTVFAEEVARPLGLEAWVGTPAEELSRVAYVHKIRLGHLPKVLRQTQEAAERAMRDPEALLGSAFLGNGTKSGYDEVEVVFNNPAVLAAEFPAGGGTATARALARLWACMGAGGELDGVRILSPEIVEAWSKVVQREPDQLFQGVQGPRLTSGLTKAVTPRTVAHLGNVIMPGLGGRFGPNPEAYGAEGLGGQESFCDPASRIAVGFVRSELAMLDVVQSQLTGVLYECAHRLGHDVYVAPKPSAAKRALGSYLRRRLAVPAA